jgi:hypothetical protein
VPLLSRYKDSGETRLGCSYYYNTSSKTEREQRQVNLPVHVCAGEAEDFGLAGKFDGTFKEGRDLGQPPVHEQPHFCHSPAKQPDAD